MKKQMKITEATYKRNLKKFAKEGHEEFSKLEEFMSRHHFNRNAEDELLGIIDLISSHAWSMSRFCTKNGISDSRWTEDYINC